MTRLQLIRIAAFGSLALLAGAYVFQTLGYAPCKMCLWQRWPHGVAIVLGGISFVWAPALLALAGALAALTTAGIGFYHTGVERGVFEGPDTCTSNGIDGISAEQLMEQIMSAPLIRCDEVAWEFLTLSMASWNMIISLVLAGIWIAAWRKV
jgi:disulfide bond formation protein DsbB